MVSQAIVDQQLSQLGIQFRRFGRSELRELKNILVPGESICDAANGVYSGGFAMIVATDLRLLIVDKKPFKLNIEDLRYQMISETGFQSMLFDALLTINVPHKTITFRSWHQAHLRQLACYVQERVMQSNSNVEQRPQAYQDTVTPNPVILRPQVIAAGAHGARGMAGQLFQPRRSTRTLQRALSRIVMQQSTQMFGSDQLFTTH